MSRGGIRRLIVTITTTAVLMALLPTPARAAQADVLILASLASGGSNSFEVAAAKQLNLTYELVDDATWSAKQTADFAKYKAIVLGDPTCGNLVDASVAQANTATWGAAVTGNVVLVGTDPTYHGVYGNNKAGAAKLILKSIQLAASGSGTGASVSLSCYYENAGSGTPVPLLNGFAQGGFKVVGIGNGCPDASHVVDDILGVTDSDLAGWSCSTHEAFTTWPASFRVVAIQQDMTSTGYTAVDGTHGAPYILVRSGNTRFDPQVNGYNFKNVGDVTKNGQPYKIPYDRMKDYYPNSYVFFYDFFHPLFPEPSLIGGFFYDQVFKPFYDAGLCFGMASSSVHYFNSGGRPDLYHLPGGSLDAESLNGTPVRDILELWHSRQLGAKGAHDSITSWTQTPNASGNAAAFQRIASVVASRPMVVGIGPSKALYNSDMQRWIDLFMNVSHAVVAYGVDPADATQLVVYDPNYQGGQSARIQLQADGGLKLVHIDPLDPTQQQQIDIGNGGKGGSPTDWVLVPLDDSAFGASGNDTWALTPADIWLILKNTNLPKGFITGKPPLPMLPFHGIVPGAPTFAGMVPAGTDVSAEVTNLGDGSDTTLIAGSHVVSAEQSGGTGTNHLVTLSADASAIALSGASAAETFDLVAGADIGSQYSRSVQLRGVSLNPGASIRYSTDAEAATYTFVSSGGSAQSVSATITQTFQAPLVMQLRLPADGTATLHIYDWGALGSSLVWEDVQTATGTTVNILQDNPAQRGGQVARDLDALRLALATTTPAGFATSLQAKIDQAADLLTGGAPSTAANVLGALQHEIAAQTGKHLTQAQADAAEVLLGDAIGLLQAQ
jgi:hypothetical protein